MTKQGFALLQMLVNLLQLVTCDVPFSSESRFAVQLGRCVRENLVVNIVNDVCDVGVDFCEGWWWSSGSGSSGGISRFASGVGRFTCFWANCSGELGLCSFVDVVVLFWLLDFDAHCLQRPQQPERLRARPPMIGGQQQLQRHRMCAVSVFECTHFTYTTTGRVLSHDLDRTGGLHEHAEGAASGHDQERRRISRQPSMT